VPYTDRRLGVRRHPLDRELKRAVLLDRALRQHADSPVCEPTSTAMAFSGAVARDADGRLDLRRNHGVAASAGSAARSAGFSLRFVTWAWFAGPAAPRSFLSANIISTRVERGDHAGRVEPASSPRESRTSLIPRNIHVDEPVRRLAGHRAPRLGDDIDVEPLPGDGSGERVEFVYQPRPSMKTTRPFFDAKSPGSGSFGPSRRGRAELGYGRDQGARDGVRALALDEAL